MKIFIIAFIILLAILVLMMFNPYTTTDTQSGSVVVDRPYSQVKATLNNPATLQKIIQKNQCSLLSNRIESIHLKLGEGVSGSTHIEILTSDQRHLHLRQSFSVTKQRMQADVQTVEPSGRLKFFQNQLTISPEGNQTRISLTTTISYNATVPVHSRLRKINSEVVQSQLDALQAVLMEAPVAPNRPIRNLLQQILR